MGDNRVDVNKKCNNFILSTKVDAELTPIYVAKVRQLLRHS